MKSRLFAMAVLMISIAFILSACQTKEVTYANVYIHQENWDKARE